MQKLGKHMDRPTRWIGLADLQNVPHQQRKNSLKGNTWGGGIFTGKRTQTAPDKSRGSKGAAEVPLHTCPIGLPTGGTIHLVDAEGGVLSAWKRISI